MDEPIPLTGAAGKVSDISERKEAAARASATPLPGPLADAFAISPDISVGKYKVRAFLEGDFELLQALEHPLYEMLIAMFSGKENKADYFPRGLVAWELCYMFTHSFDDIEELLKNSGVGQFKAVAKSEFGRLPTAAILRLHQAVLKQVMQASSTAIAFGSSEDDEGSKKNAAVQA